MRVVAAESDGAPAFERAASEAQRASSAMCGGVRGEARRRPRAARRSQVVFDAEGRCAPVGERECSHPAAAPEGRRGVVLRPSSIGAREPAPARPRWPRRAPSATSPAAPSEFLLARDGSFYFLEMNTRLQVEHPITEEVWGVDLVREMIRDRAVGEPLSFAAATLRRRGHAIECRIYAEDPRRGFRAVARHGSSRCALPQGPGVRHDVGVRKRVDRADRLRPDARKADRERAAAGPRRSRAWAGRWRSTKSSGIKTSLPFFRDLVDDPDFLAAAFDTRLARPPPARAGARPSAAADDDRRRSRGRGARREREAVRAPGAGGSRHGGTPPAAGRSDEAGSSGSCSRAGGGDDRRRSSRGRGARGKSAGAPSPLRARAEGLDGTFVALFGRRSGAFSRSRASRAAARRRASGRAETAPAFDPRDEASSCLAGFGTAEVLAAMPGRVLEVRVEERGTAWLPAISW